VILWWAEPSARATR